jgi:ankyrin repeat protein
VEQPSADGFLREVDHRPDRALDLLAAAPALRADPWVALSLGDVPDGIDATTPGGPLSRLPLFYVARSRVAKDNLAAARLLLERGADPNGSGGEEWTNLSIASSRGDAALVRLLLAAGADPNDNDSLYHSVEPADEGCTRLLLEHGATVLQTNALWHALDFDRIGRVELLLEHDGDPNESTSWPALHHAVTRGRGPDFVRLLVAHGARLDHRARDGRTAFQLALRRGRDDLVETLRELGALTTADDQDCALWAVSRGERSATEIRLDDDARDVLIELAMRDTDSLQHVVDAVGANFSARWGGGPRGSLLHQAAWFGRPDFVRLLLERGAEPDARVATEYATPLGWAAVGSRYSPAHPNDSFSSPDGDYVGVAELLVAAGARTESKFAEMAVPPLADWLVRT